jgi:hypothetical protein
MRQSLFQLGNFSANTAISGFRVCAAGANIAV